MDLFLGSTTKVRITATPLYVEGRRPAVRLVGPALPYVAPNTHQLGILRSHEVRD